jgi:hypothetical protein
VISGLKQAEKVVLVSARTLPSVGLGSVLLNSQHIIRGRDEREQCNDNGRNADSLDDSTAETRIARNSTRNAQCADQRQCPEQSPGQVKGRVELQQLKNNM